MQNASEYEVKLHIMQDDVQLGCKLNVNVLEAGQCVDRNKIIYTYMALSTQADYLNS